MSAAVLERVVPVVLTRREQRLVTIAWELGRTFGHREVGDAIVEAQAIPVRLPTSRSWDQQVAERIREMEQFDYRAWQDANMRQLAKRDAENLAAGAGYRPLSYEDMWPGLDRAVRDRICDEYRERDRDGRYTGRWLPGTPEVIQRG